MFKNITKCVIQNFSNVNNISLLGIRLSPVVKSTCFVHSTIEGYDKRNVPVNCDYHEIKSYNEYLDDNKMGLGKAVLTLIKTLDVTRENATKVVREWKIFGSLSRATIIQNHDRLREEGVRKSTLRQNMYALADTSANIARKIQYCKDAELDIETAIPLFRLKAYELDFFATVLHPTDKRILIEHKNRIEYLADVLNVDITDLCTNLARYPHVLNTNLELLMKKTKMMLDFGILGEYIMNDLIAYRSVMETFKERLPKAKAAGIDPLKPWILRCPIEVIDAAEKRTNVRSSLFNGATSLEEHISNTMECDIEAVRCLLRREPDIYVTNIPKLTENLTFLKNCGYRIEDLYRSPLSIQAQTTTLKNKYETWTSQGLGKPPLFLLATSKKVFEQKMKTYLRNRILTKQSLKI